MSPALRSAAKSSRLEDLGRQCLGVERNERPVPSGPILMDGPGDVPLARAGFADEQHGSRRTRGQTNLLEQPAMGRPEAEQAVEARCFVKLAPDLEQLDVQPVGLRFGNAVAVVFVAHHAQQTDQAVVLVAERPEFDPAPDSLAAGVEDQRGGSGGLAGQRFRGRMEARRQVGRIIAAGRSVGVTGQTHDRLRTEWPVNVSQARLTQAIRSSESSQKVGSRAFCQSSVGLELARPWMRHETHDRSVPSAWPKRLQDQTTCPMMSCVSASSNSTGISGNSRPRSGSAAG